MSNTKKLCFSAMMLAVGILLPMVFHMIPDGGVMFAPMHLPVFCTGFICGPYFGALIGLVCPLLSSLFTGMPAVAYLPNMMIELLVYGSLSGLFFRIIKTKKFMLDVFLSLVLSMLIGRISGGLVACLMYLGGRRPDYSWAIFFTTYFVTCWPAILIQVFVIPSVVLIAKKARFIGENDRYLDSSYRKKNTKIQREFFDGLADEWRKEEGISAERLEELFAEIPLSDGMRVLDVACGAGVIDGFLLSKAVAVDAIDLSEKMIERARSDESLKGVNFAVADFYEFETSARYDCIIVFDAYPHFIDKENFAKKAFGLLKEGGGLYILFDESRQKINGYHKRCNGKISVDLLPPEKEASTFKPYFDTFKTIDDNNFYLIGLVKKNVEK